MNELEDFFDVTKMGVTSAKGKSYLVEQRPIVLCRSVEGLIEYIKARRNVDDYFLKIGIDGGQGSIKVVMCIEDKAKHQSEQRLKDSGVRQAFILALAPGIQENYENISMFWDHLQLTTLNCFVAGECFLHCSMR